MTGWYQSDLGGISCNLGKYIKTKFAAWISNTVTFTVSVIISIFKHLKNNVAITQNYNAKWYVSIITDYYTHRHISMEVFPYLHIDSFIYFHYKEFQVIMECFFTLEKWTPSHAYLSPVTSLPHQNSCVSIDLGQVMGKRVLCHMQTTKAQISLCIRTVWSAPLLFAAWIVWYVYLLYPKFQDSK